MKLHDCMSFYYFLICFATVNVLCYTDDCDIYSEGCVAISRTIHWIPCSEIYKLMPLQTLHIHMCKHEYSRYERYIEARTRWISIFKITQPRAKREIFRSTCRNVLKTAIVYMRRICMTRLYFINGFDRSQSFRGIKSGGTLVQFTRKSYKISKFEKYRNIFINSSIKFIEIRIITNKN